MKGTAIRLVLLAGLLLFFFLAHLPERSLFWRAFFDAGHTPLFGFVALLIHGLLEAHPRALPSRLSSPAGKVLTAFALAMVLGGVTEFVQMVFRLGDPSLSDLLRDAAGAASFLLLADVVRSGRGGAVAEDGVERRRPLGLRRRWAIAAALVLLIAAGATLTLTSAAYVARRSALPTLFPLDGSWWEARFITTGNSRLVTGSAAGAPRLTPPSTAPLARLDLRAGRYPGITLAEPYPDWRRYRRLVFTIVSDLDAPLPVSIRIHDAPHDHRYRDRFNRRLTVRPGTNRFAISLDDVRRAPAGRQMDMRRIRGVILYVPRLAQPTHLYLGPLRLE